MAIRWTDFPECPKCGCSDQDWWDGLNIKVEDGSTWDATCSSCGTDYKVTASVGVTFKTDEVDHA